MKHFDNGNGKRINLGRKKPAERTAMKRHTLAAAEVRRRLPGKELELAEKSLTKGHECTKRKFLLMNKGIGSVAILLLSNFLGYSALEIAEEHSGVFHIAVENRLERYDLAARSWMPALTFSEGI